RGPGGPPGRSRRLPPLAQRRPASGARRPDGRSEILPVVRADLAFAQPRAAAALAGAEQPAQPAEIPRQRRGAQRQRLVFRFRRAARRQALPACGRTRTDLVKSGLPVDEVLGPLREAPAAPRVAVLEAPPGAGKSTVVPLALLEEEWAAGKRLIILEPRRLAARACAERMAQTLGESVGRTVGYRMRFDSRVSGATRIEVVTEGVLTRLLQGDPALEGVAALIFDEFHERSLQADLGLALSLDARAHLAPELRLLVMSATLDGAAVASLLGEAPRVSAPGRLFPVETHYAGFGSPALPDAAGTGAQDAPERLVAQLILRALREERGDVLAFLPGAREIRRVHSSLAAAQLPAAVEVLPLFGDLPGEQQDAALAPAPRGARKVVLATNIAETSLTIPGVRVVVDSGLARRASFDPVSGMSLLTTQRISRASADQ